MESPVFTQTMREEAALLGWLQQDEKDPKSWVELVRTTACSMDPKEPRIVRSEAFETYTKTLEDLLELRARELRAENDEDDFVHRLEHLWWQMSEDEQKLAEDEDTDRKAVE
jgi:hypothetical protein